MAVFLCIPSLVFAAVAHDATSESHTGVTGSTNQASFSWTHTPTGTPRGVLVYVHTISATQTVTSVTYGGVTMTQVAGGAAVDTAGEPGRVDTYFLGVSIPPGAQTIVVNRTNNAVEMYASASTQTAGANTEIYTPGVVLLQENGAYAVQSVTDGSIGINSVRYASGYYGGNGTLPAGTGSTLLNSIDYGSFTSTTAVETTPGQGARNVGFTQATADDRAAVHLAVREIPNTAPTLSITQPDGVGDTVTVGSSYTVTYSLTDPEQIVTAAFYYDTDNTGLNGTAITGACSTAGEGTNATCAWNTTGVTPGTYYVYGLTSDGVAPQVSAYSPGTITINPAAITTIADGGNPSSITIAPGAASTDLDAFTLTTNIGTDTVTALTVTLSPAGAFNNIAQVDLTDNTNVVRCTAVTNLTSNTVSFTTCTANGGVSVTTSATTYKVRITPKSHANMPVPPGASYATTGTVTSFTSTNTQAGTDGASATITTDNLSPNGATGTSGSSGSAQVTLNWTTSSSADFSRSVMLRWTGVSAGSEVPTEGTDYANGNAIGTATVVCVRTADSASTAVSGIDGGGTGGCSATPLTNGQAYTYKIFQKDSNGNYDVGTSIGTLTPSPAPTTTLATGTDPSATTIAPGSSATDVNQFTLQTNTGIETVTAVTVNLSTNSGVSRLAITNNANAELGFTTSPVTGSNTISVSGMSAGTSLTTFKVRVTPLAHTSMPAVPGGAYAITAPVTAWTGSYIHTGSDTNPNALAIDNLSPANVTSASGSAGNAQTTTTWTNPADADFHSTVVLRRAGSTVGDVPIEGVTYLNGDTIGTATVACVVPSSAATCTDIGLTNGTAYHYKIFSKDANGNYAAGVIPTGSPFTPSLTTFTITATAGTGGTVTPPGVTTIAQGDSQIYTITPDSGYNIETLVVDGSGVATSTSYTFGNVQTNHTIAATFVLIPVPTFTITASSGANGTVTPAGVTTISQGASQTYTIAPSAGYDVETLIVDSVSVATSTSYTFTNVQANHMIAATFVLIPVPPGSFTINATAGAGGSITPVGVTTVTQGNSQTYTITPNSGYNIETLVVDGSGVATSTSYTFTNVQANHTIATTFVAIPPPPGSFSITASTGTGGTITPSGTTTIAQGASQTYTITPNTSYNIATLVIDGSSVATSTSYTFTNVQANHTIAATFVVIAGATPQTLPDVGATRPTTIIFFGKAFPFGKVSIANKELRTEKIIGQEITPTADGSFRISFIGVLQGLQSFGLIAKDKDNRVAQTKFFFVDTTSESFLEKELLVPPTIDILAGQVPRGTTTTIFGYASPNHSVHLAVDDILTKEVAASTDGTYTFELPTGALEFGQHRIKTKQIDPATKRESDFSTTRTFIVSRLTTVKADFSGDGKIDIRDWSIFLSRWASKNTRERTSIDLSGDGKVDIADFSIFIKTIRK